MLERGQFVPTFFHRHMLMSSSTLWCLRAGSTRSCWSGQSNLIAFAQNKIYRNILKYANNAYVLGSWLVLDLQWPTHSVRP